MLHELILGICLFLMAIYCVACVSAPTDAPPTIPTETSSTPVPTPVSIPFPIYADQVAGGPAFVPSGWMGDIAGISLDESWKENPQEGNSCIHVTYKPQSDGPGWAGVCWLPPRLDPSKEWGAQVNGIDLSGASRLTFWARGASDKEHVKFFVGGVEGPKGDSLSEKESYVDLTTEWRQYSINLNGADLTNVITAFGWVATAEVEFWVDDVRFE
jgi:hypothetical protein